MPVGCAGTVRAVRVGPGPSTPVYEELRVRELLAQHPHEGNVPPRRTPWRLAEVAPATRDPRKRRATGQRRRVPSGRGLPPSKLTRAPRAGLLQRLLHTARPRPESTRRMRSEICRRCRAGARCRRSQRRQSVDSGDDKAGRQERFRSSRSCRLTTGRAPARGELVPDLVAQDLAVSRPASGVRREPEPADRRSSPGRSVRRRSG